MLILIGAALFSLVARQRPQTGRALLREIRASFYRKLFLAFVLASIVPVLTLALVIRAYFAGLLLDDIRGEASRTAAVAERVIEESDAMLRRGAQGLTPYDDDVMVWISQLIDQDVNIFYGPELVATSERDLFASGLLPTRTSDDVYRAIALERLPNYVSEDNIGGVPYMLAATPVRSGGRDAILTVPLAFRQQEVEREIDDLDRGLHLAALFFIMLGAGIGLSMAERIADPVRRLTRATGRIARGDFDARIAVRSSDELRRLVDAFNGMAAELKAQRGQLERTHRLEAWAEMARQVAHEIKNPLTPIQLSAEHLRRVHTDRGEPMSPVLEGCVDTILGQVRLLRQIASEFSSFASSPTARLAPVDPIQLVRDVVDPYRSGLGDRIAIDNEIDPGLPAGHGRSHARGAGARQHRRERAARDARSRTAAADLFRERRLRDDSGRGHRCGDGRGSARASLRAVFLDQDDRHRAGPADRAAEHRVERRDDRGDERERTRYGGQRYPAGGVVTGRRRSRRIGEHRQRRDDVRIRQHDQRHARVRRDYSRARPRRETGSMESAASRYRSP